jgi:ABC-type antimicrobial peptide transport system permease subunit
MIKSLYGVAWRTLQANRALMLSSVISVALSVFLVITMVLFANNAKQSIEQEMRRLFGDFDIMAGFDSNADIIDRSMLSRISTIEGIEKNSPVLLDHMFIDQLDARIYTAGVDNDPLAKSRYKFASDIGELDVVTNSSLAEALQLDIGDEVLIEGRPFRLLETVSDADSSGIGVDFLIVSRETLKQFSSLELRDFHEATYVILKATSDADFHQITADLRSLSEHLRIDVVQESEYYTLNMHSLQYFLIVVSALVLIAAVLFNLASAETLLYKYRSQIAVMRSLGATRRQVARMVGTQLSLLTFSGTAGGFGLALISNQLVQRWMLDLMNVPVTVIEFPLGTALLAALSSFLLIQAFMFIPVLRSMKIAPLRIIAHNERLHIRPGKKGLLSGIMLLGGALFFLVKGLREMETGYGELWILISAFCLLIGLIQLFNHYLASLMTAVAPLVKRVAGSLSFVAIRNLIPQMHRNKLVILSISMLLIISMLGSAIFTSIKHNQDRFLSDQFHTNVLVTARWDNNSLPDPQELKETVQELTRIETVGTVSRVRLGYIQSEGEWQEFEYQLGDLEALMEFGMIDTVSGQLPPDGVVISEELAERYHLQVGDQVEVGMFSLERQAPVHAGRVTIVGIQSELPNGYTDAYIAWGNMRDDPYALFDVLYLQSPDPFHTLVQLEELDRIYPLQLQVNSYDRALAEAHEMFMQRFAIFIAVLIVISVSVLLGICNAMMNNLESKRKEYALLRAIAVTREGIIRSVMTQVLLFVVIGSMFGMTAGALATWVVSFIDAGNMYFDIRLPLLVSIILIVVSIAVFAPYAHSAGKRHLLAELNRDAG